MTTIVILLILLWALGFVNGYALGGFLHLLLIIALVVFVIDIINRRTPLP